jgi:hypothetical protein
MCRCFGIGMMGCGVSYISDDVANYMSNVVDRLVVSLVSVNR